MLLLIVICASLQDQQSKQMMWCCWWWSLAKFCCIDRLSFLESSRNRIINTQEQKGKSLTIWGSHKLPNVSPVNLRLIPVVWSPPSWFRPQEVDLVRFTMEAPIFSLLVGRWFLIKLQEGDGSLREGFVCVDRPSLLGLALTITKLHPALLGFLGS